MIIFFGPAGSGKSTQAQILVENDQFKWFSMGQLLRNTADLEVHELMKKGELVSNEKTNQILGEALLSEADYHKLIIDGYPRDIDQACWLVNFCNQKNIKIDLVISLDVNIEESLKRMQLRGRIDDTAGSIKRRLDIYHQSVDPILAYLSSQEITIKTIDGIGSIEDIYKRIKEVMIECKLV